MDKSIPVSQVGGLPQSARVEVETLIMNPVHMLVIHKPSNRTAAKEVPIKDCRKFFLAAVESLKQVEPESKEEDFIAVQIDWKDKTVITSTL